MNGPNNQAYNATGNANNVANNQTDNGTILGFKKENLPIVFALALPVFVVCFIGLLIFVPKLGPRPMYDFIFTATSGRSLHTSDGACTVFYNYYQIAPTEGTYNLVKKEYQISALADQKVIDPCASYPRMIESDAPELYLYLAKDDTVRQINFEEATQFTYKKGLVSDDGYTVGKRYVNRGVLDIFGGGGTNSGVFASKRNRYVRLNIPEALSGSYYDADFNFIGWVEGK